MVEFYQTGSQTEDLVLESGSKHAHDQRAWWIKAHDKRSAWKNFTPQLLLTSIWKTLCWNLSLAHDENMRRKSSPG